MKKRWFRIIALALTLLLVAPLIADNHEGILDKVKSRGKLVCGVHGGLPGFGFLSEDGKWNGFDTDFGRAIAAAVLGDPDKIEFVPLNAAERFTALQSGEVDVLIRNTTWTLGRDSELNADFAPPTFYDGQGFMVSKSLNLKSLDQLEGASIGVTSGSTTELNLADTMRSLGVEYKSVPYEDIDTLYNSYDAGRVDAVTSDKSQLVARRKDLKNPDDHVILDATISKEPLGPLTIHGDNEWNDVVSWVVYSTFFAEEHKITQENVEGYETNNPEINRFLGEEGEMGKKLGLPKDWAKQVIMAVGNYGEIFERNLTPIGLPRGVNKPWTQGGLLYSMPFR